MSSKILYEAIALIRASKLDEARKMLFEIIRNEPTNEMAWMWLAETLSSDNDRMKVLLACQMENPNSKITKIAIQKLQEKIDQEAEKSSFVAPFKEGETFDPSMPDRTGHTGAIIGFDGSFIVSEVSDFDDVIDLRNHEEDDSKIDDIEFDDVGYAENQDLDNSHSKKEESDAPLFEDTTDETQTNELLYEPDFSNLFQDEEPESTKESDFVLDNNFNFDSDQSEDDNLEGFNFQLDDQYSEDENDELTAIDLGFMDDSPTILSTPDITNDDTDRIRALMQEDDLIEDHVIQSRADEFERERKKKDRNLIIFVAGVFILITILCISAVYVILNNSKFEVVSSSASATQPIIVQMEVTSTETLLPTFTITPKPTETPTPLPTGTPLVALSNDALNPDNVISLQIKTQKETKSQFTISLDGSRMALIEEKKVLVFNSFDGSLVYELDDHTANVSQVEYSTNGEYLLSAANDFSIYLWNLNSGTLEKRFMLDVNSLNQIFGSSNKQLPRNISLDYSPDGTTIAAGAFGMVNIFDIPTGLARGLYTIDPNELKAIVDKSETLHGFNVRFNENGWILVASMSGYLVGLDTLDSSPLYKINLGENAKVRFTDNRLTMLEEDIGGVVLRRLDTGEIYNGFDGIKDKPNNAPPDYRFSDNGEIIAIETTSDANDIQLTVWNVLEDKEVATFPPVCENDTNECRLPSFNISPNGDWIAVERILDRDILVDIIDLENLVNIHTFDKFSSGVQSISVSPTTEIVAILNKNGVLRIWDVKFGAQRVSLDATDMDIIEFSRNGRVLFGWNEDQLIVWSLP